MKRTGVEKALGMGRDAVVVAGAKKEPTPNITPTKKRRTLFGVVLLTNIRLGS
jgi:hypothetical protein